jgi:hypothetical protein
MAMMHNVSVSIERYTYVAMNFVGTVLGYEWMRLGNLAYLRVTLQV